MPSTSSTPSMPAPMQAMLEPPAPQPVDGHARRMAMRRAMQGGEPIAWSRDMPQDYEDGYDDEGSEEGVPMSMPMPSAMHAYGDGMRPRSSFPSQQQLPMLHPGAAFHAAHMPGHVPLRFGPGMMPPPMFPQMYGSMHPSDLAAFGLGMPGMGFAWPGMPGMLWPHGLQHMPAPPSAPADHHRQHGYAGTPEAAAVGQKRNLQVLQIQHDTPCSPAECGATPGAAINATDSAELPGAAEDDSVQRHEAAREPQFSHATASMHKAADARVLRPVSTNVMWPGQPQGHVQARYHQAASIYQAQGAASPKNKRQRLPEDAVAAASAAGNSMGAGKENADPGWSPSVVAPSGKGKAQVQPVFRGAPTAAPSTHVVPHGRAAASPSTGTCQPVPQVSHLGAAPVWAPVSAAAQTPPHGIPGACRGGTQLPGANLTAIAGPAALTAPMSAPPGCSYRQPPGAAVGMMHTPSVALPMARLAGFSDPRAAPCARHPADRPGTFLPPDQPAAWPPADLPAPAPTSTTAAGVARVAEASQHVLVVGAKHPARAMAAAAIAATPSQDCSDRAPEQLSAQADRLRGSQEERQPVKAEQEVTGQQQRGAHGQQQGSTCSPGSGSEDASNAAAEALTLLAAGAVAGSCGDQWARQGAEEPKRDDALPDALPVHRSRSGKAEVAEQPSGALPSGDSREAGGEPQLGTAPQTTHVHQTKAQATLVKAGTDTAPPHSLSWEGPGPDGAAKASAPTAAPGRPSAFRPVNHAPVSGEWAQHVLHHPGQGQFGVAAHMSPGFTGSHGLYEEQRRQSRYSVDEQGSWPVPQRAAEAEAGPAGAAVRSEPEHVDMAGGDRLDAGPQLPPMQLHNFMLAWQQVQQLQRMQQLHQLHFPMLQHPAMAAPHLQMMSMRGFDLGHPPFAHRPVPGRAVRGDEEAPWAGSVSPDRGQLQLLRGQSEPEQPSEP